MFKLKRIMFITIAVLLGIIVVLAALRFTGEVPVRNFPIAELPDCPSSPNCVCSQNSDDAHTIAPVQIVGSAAKSWQTLKRVIANRGGKLVSESPGEYARFEFHSRVFRYVDDVEILLNEIAGQIEIRSASRTGRSDLGVNRKRVESIREKFAAQIKSPE